jgi:hypothetical protein
MNERHQVNPSGTKGGEKVGGTRKKCKRNRGNERDVSMLKYSTEWAVPCLISLCKARERSVHTVVVSAPAREQSERPEAEVGSRFDDNR